MTTSRRYNSVYAPSGGADGVPIIEAQARWKPEREPVHVRATASEIGIVALTWAGAALAVFIGIDYVTRFPLGLWPTAGYVVPSVFLVVACLWATWHYRADERRRGRDDYAWGELETTIAAREKENKRLLSEIGRLNAQLGDRDASIAAMRRQNARYVDARPLPDDEEHVTQKAADEAASNARTRFNNALRFIVDRWENGNPDGYGRDACVNAGAMTGSEWTSVMDALEAGGFIRRTGRGGARTIYALRAADIMQKVMR